MPFFETTLRNFIKNKLEPQRVLPIFAKVLDGVEAAHLQKVVHRDIKPENILCDTKGERVVVADFGIAHFIPEERYTSVETSRGSKLLNQQYAAPEQRARGGVVDHRADIFALGLILNELFTGEVPHGSDPKTIGEVFPDYSYLDEVVHSLISQDPGRRYSSIDELKKDIMGRGQLWASRQRLASLRAEVVRDSEIDDPLIRTPPQISAYDYRNGSLIITLTPSPSADWIGAFRSQGGFRSFMGGPTPRDIVFQGANQVILPAREPDAIEQFAMFREWLRGGIVFYEQWAKEKHRAALQKSRDELEGRRRAEEARQRVLGTLRL
jgi:serine/threonine protein kinase